jgi:hypothetical protein
MNMYHTAIGSQSNDNGIFLPTIAIEKCMAPDSCRAMVRKGNSISEDFTKDTIWKTNRKSLTSVLLDSYVYITYIVWTQSNDNGIFLPTIGIEKSDLITNC